MWMIRTKQMWKNGTPMVYISSEDGQLHAYTEDSQVSFFANKILDYLPDYTANGKVIRRNASPYFGVEAGFTI